MKKALNGDLKKSANNVVLKETGYIGICVIVLSLLTECVFLILGRWDLKVLLGNLLGAAAAILNFYLMGITVKKAVAENEKDAKDKIRLTRYLRTFMLFGIAAIGCQARCFNPAAVLISLFFPRIAIALRPVFAKY